MSNAGYVCSPQLKAEDTSNYPVLTSHYCLYRLLSPELGLYDNSLTSSKVTSIIKSHCRGSYSSYVSEYRLCGTNYINCVLWDPSEEILLTCENCLTATEHQLLIVLVYWDLTSFPNSKANGFSFFRHHIYSQNLFWVTSFLGRFNKNVCILSKTKVTSYVMCDAPRIQLPTYPQWQNCTKHAVI